MALALRLAVLFLAVSAVRAAEPKVLMDWTFDQPGDLRGWVPNGDCTGVTVADGALSAKASERDPFLVGPVFEVPATPFQWVEAKVRCDKPGRAAMYWSNTMVSPYAGFFPERNTGYLLPGDGQWHVIHIRPYWQAEHKIIHLRFGIGRGQRFSIAWIRLLEPAALPAPLTEARFDRLDGWIPAEEGLQLSPPLDVPLDGLPGAAIRLSATGDAPVRLVWATAQTNGLHEASLFPRGDGRPHTYWFEPSDAAWSGRLLALGLRLPDGARAEAVRLADAASGPPDLAAIWFGPLDTLLRAGRPAKFICRVANLGADTATGVSAELTAPAGVTVKADPQPTTVESGSPVTLSWTLTAPQPIQGQVSVRLSGLGAPAAPLRAPLNVTAAPDVPRDGLAPPLQPAQTKYQVGTYYFPGWWNASRWTPVDEVMPWRRPALGWYDEANPACADWQIKWAVEHGVNFFLVDWYWLKGHKSLDHWVEHAYAGSRYKSALKWAVMWANHNPKGSNSAEDWHNLVQYWLDHYLKTPEYLWREGKPAVFIWWPGGISDDVGGTAAATKLYATAQDMAKAAGLPGITFVAMNIEGGDTSGTKTLHDEGYAAETHYHGHYDALQYAADWRWAPFSLLTEHSPHGWDTHAALCAQSGLAYYPVADTGWDPRPWHGDASNVIYGRTPQEFEKLLREAKTWLDAHGRDTLVLGPWNEWGEGSYLEPNVEYGFGMLDAVRRVFCTGPEAPDLVPADVNAPSYEFTDVLPKFRDSWRFDQPGESYGWSAMMGLTDFGVSDGAMHARSTNTDPAFSAPVGALITRRWGCVTVTMAVKGSDHPGDLQLFWSAAGRSMTEEASARLPLIADGQMHRYVFDLRAHARWHGTVTQLRLDPGDAAGLDVRVADIHLSAAP
jgi:hypothetical protein